jgi:hypothetical protein
MYDLTGSAWDLGLVGLLQFAPALGGFLYVAGAAAARYARSVPALAAEPESQAKIASRERSQPSRGRCLVRPADRPRVVQPPYIRPAACAGPW